MPLSKRTIGKHVRSSKLDKTGFDNFDSPRRNPEGTVHIFLEIPVLKSFISKMGTL